MELNYLKHFLKEILIDDMYDVISTEQPDFILKQDNYNIGVEVVNFYSTEGTNSNSIQVQNSKRLKAISLAKKEYEKKIRSKFEFNISFNENYPITDIKVLAFRISSFLEKYSQIRSKNFFKISNCEEINGIYCNWQEYPDADWKLTQLYDVPPLNKNYMINLIKQKNLKLKQYQDCDEYWLLIIIDFWDPSQDQDLFSYIESDNYSAPNNHFKRIYICRFTTKDFIKIIN